MTRTKPSVEILSTGRFLPPRILTNQDLEKMVDTSDTWIRDRTGIRERRIVDDGVTASDLAEASARKALDRAGISPAEIDVLLVSTATPDRWLPSTACHLQARLGANRCFAADVHAACSGFLYNLALAEGFLATGRGDTALVVATEVMSSIIDWDDRSTCVLFGDGSGAAVLRRSSGTRGLLSHHHRSDGSLSHLLHRPAGGVEHPLDSEGLDRGDHLVKMAGREVFKSAVRAMADASTEALKAAGVSVDEVDLMIPHQANIRIIEATARYAGIPMERVYVNLDRFGNMSSASIPVALDECLEEGRIGKGDLVLSAAFGAGLTWGASVMQF